MKHSISHSVVIWLFETDAMVRKMVFFQSWQNFGVAHATLATLVPPTLINIFILYILNLKCSTMAGFLDLSPISTGDESKPIWLEPELELKDF